MSGMSIAGDKVAYDKAYNESKRLMNQSFYVDAHRYSKGWNTQNGCKFYINSQGALQTRWMDLSRKRYYYQHNFI